MVPGFLVSIVLGVVASVIFFGLVKFGAGIRQWARTAWVERKQRKANEEMIDHLREIEGEDGFL